MSPEERARRWREVDPDPVTRRQTDEVLARDDPAELQELFGQHLGFGTAGIRAPLGPGPARMNRLVVRRVATAIALHLLEQGTPDDAPTAVLGHDARHGSERFAADVVEVLAARGVQVERFDEPVPTPLVAFAVRERGVDAAIMITASHNPARDNGLKVFAADGAQIVAPADRRIAAILAELPLAAGAPPGPGVGAVRHLGGPAMGGEVVERYVSRAIGLSGRHRDGRAQLATPLQVVHTSLHGVGDRLLRTVLDRVDGLDAHPVSAQQHPDPDFPTVSSPNPECHATLELLLHDARELRADVALALDPDADRLAVALPARGDLPHAAPAAWSVLSGDELGALLAAHLLGSTSGADRLVTTTVVSSRLVPSMCDAAGVLHVETLTGFKWLCRPAIDHPERRQLLAYEEALGYAVGADARDKDGITAAVTLLDAVARWRAEGVGPWDVLDDLARRHGAHVTCNGSLQLAATTPWTGRMDAWASTPPDALGGVRVVDADRPASDVLRWWLEDRTRVVVRPSGTEPKVKYYGEAIEPVRGDPAAAREAARRRLEPVVAEVVALLRG